ncbi:hypothetical protein [Micromonospora cremea]|uniref:hypothetical protein n=1 Tax=Micromonospora cremea TaxID=709881 RepID=UPI000941137F|nr:hypothetical protein [Micromonospora cremea]
MLHFDGSQLRLAAGHDLTYHHGLEVIFTDVAYMACPTQFWDPRFRDPTLDERALVRRHVGEESPVVVAFDVDAPAGGDLPSCLVAAGSVEVVHGRVWLRTCDRRSHREVRTLPEPRLLLLQRRPVRRRARTTGGTSVQR